MYIKIAGFSHAGQSCISTQRILLHEAIADQLEGLTGLHGTLDARAEQCGLCHAEHHGAGADLVVGGVKGAADAAMTFGKERNGLSTGIGSGSQTSIAAAERCPDCRAVTSASVSIKSPRARFTTTAPRFTRPSEASFSSFFVCGVEGQCSVTMSD